MTFRIVPLALASTDNASDDDRDSSKRVPCVSVRHGFASAYAFSFVQSCESGMQSHARR